MKREHRAPIPMLKSVGYVVTKTEGDYVFATNETTGRKARVKLEDVKQFCDEIKNATPAKAEEKAMTTKTTTKSAKSSKTTTKAPAKKVATKKVATKKVATKKVATKKTTAAKTVTETKGAPSLGREGSISHLIRSMILKGKTNAEILKAARKAFPKAKIDDSYATWYRAQMVRAGFAESKCYAGAEA